MSWLEIWWDRNTMILRRALTARQLRIQMPGDGASWYTWTLLGGLEGK